MQPRPGVTAVYEQLPKLKMGRSSQECSICLQRFRRGEVIRQLPCGHIFHGRECLRAWLKEQSSCPNCRLPLWLA
jgi:hypothetical protein